MVPVSDSTWREADTVPVIVTVDVAVAVLLEASVAVQTTTIVPRPKEVCDGVTDTDPSAASIALATSAGTVEAPVAGKLWSEATVITGAVVSRTTPTTNGTVVVANAELLAVHVTVVDAIGNKEPEAGEQSTATVPSVESVAVGENETFFPLVSPV